MNMKKVFSIAVLMLLLVVFSYALLDTRVALFVRGAWIAHARRDIVATTIPDLLFLLVCGVTGFGWAAYSYRAHRGIVDRHTRFFLLASITVPLTFFLKSVLKIAVGRITTRFWLRHPDYPQFHWLNGGGHYDGFPSGHMAVFAALGLAIWKYYPRYRALSAVVLSVLAIALIVTDYHFVSDVIAGAYLGVLVHGGISNHLLPFLTSREENRLNRSKE
jgi:membrane-associated phospholipid phosphatase